MLYKSKPEDKIITYNFQVDPVKRNDTLCSIHTHLTKSRREYYFGWPLFSSQITLWSAFPPSLQSQDFTAPSSRPHSIWITLWLPLKKVSWAASSFECVGMSSLQFLNLNYPGAAPVLLESFSRYILAFSDRIHG